MYEVLAGCKEGTEGRTRLPAFASSKRRRLLCFRGLGCYLPQLSVASTDST